MYENLKPSERLALMALHLKNPQTLRELAAATGIRKTYHAADALRTLILMGLVTKDNSARPALFALAPDKAVPNV
jgi:DNA-binding MarR family transcriptional regulator